MSDYLKLDKAPALIDRRPECDACLMEVDFSDGDWLCPSCGTIWPGSSISSDGSDAMLYEDWSGETLPGPVVPVGIAWERARR